MSKAEMPILASGYFYFALNENDDFVKHEVIFFEHQNIWQY